jgi:hypothetical protein
MGNSAVAPLDVLVSTTLARVARIPSSHAVGAISGQSFEREVFRSLEGIHPWEHCVGPDQFDMALNMVGKSGTHYEFDSALLTHDALYVVEAKKVGVLNRQHVGIFVHKLLDVLLASRSHFEAVAIRPVLVSAGPRISPAAWLHAIAWGVSLVSPQRPTPWEILRSLESLPNSPGVSDLRADCEQLAQSLWRQINRLVYPSKLDSSLYNVATDLILGRDACLHLIEEWEYCVARAPESVSIAPREAAK